ncbi:MAG: hypothetical protein LC737_04380, partial [Chloroflexi bacterium]|nr:hypothetical protein [Chloroflexota bacterium]
MMDYLGQLAVTALNQTHGIEPRLPSRFEPTRENAPSLDSFETSEEIAREVTAPRAHAAHTDKTTPAVARG